MRKQGGPCFAPGVVVCYRPSLSCFNGHRCRVLSGTVVTPLSRFIGHWCRSLSATVAVFIWQRCRVFSPMVALFFFSHRCRVLSATVFLFHRPRSPEQDKSDASSVSLACLLRACLPACLVIYCTACLCCCDVAHYCPTLPAGGWGCGHGRIRPADGQQPVRRRPHYAASAVRRA